MNSSIESLAVQLELLQSDIKGNASSAKHRIHLFQLLCVMGNWTRALAQLQLCAQLDALAIPMAQTYREAIRCELFRAEVFSGKRTPQVMGQPPSWIGSLIEALRHDADGKSAAAAALRKKAMDTAAATPCKIDIADCEWIMDGDGRIGPVCEVIANGQYYWLPFESCSGIRIEAPSDLRDKVWAPAELLLPNQGRVPALIPTRYPETALSTAVNADDLKQSRVTEWIERGHDTWFGVGQRVWMSDVGQHSILDTRSITMNLGDSATNAVSVSTNP
jgi:type VI secretion system protein ImpE